MTHEDFSNFIDEYDLHSFDGLIEIQLKNGNRHNAVWITGTPDLDKSVDGEFQGIPDEHYIFYLFDQKEFEVWHPDIIENVTCLQQNYLQRGL